MKKIIMAVLLLSLFSCGDKDAKEILQQSAQNSYRENNVVIIEGCEYWIISGHITHKGNCKNPIHPENWSVAKVSYTNP